MHYRTSILFVCQILLDTARSIDTERAVFVNSRSPKILSVTGGSLSMLSVFSLSVKGIRAAWCKGADYISVIAEWF